MDEQLHSLQSVGWNCCSITYGFCGFVKENCVLTQISIKSVSCNSIGKTLVRIILRRPTTKMPIKACSFIQPQEQEGGCQNAYSLFTHRYYLLAGCYIKIHSLILIYLILKYLNGTRMALPLDFIQHEGYVPMEIRWFKQGYGPYCWFEVSCS